MRKLIMKMSVSVDGFVGGPNGEIDWLLNSMDEDTTAWILDTIWNAGVHIMGSRTFQDMAAYWPYSEEPFAAPMNEIPKIVFSKKNLTELISANLTTVAYQNSVAFLKAEGQQLNHLQPQHLATWTNAKVANGDLTDEIKRLKQQPGKDILAHGGASFMQSLAKADLIDEYRLLTHPVALGSGLPLFSALSKPLHLKLVGTTMFNSGAVAHVYRPG